VIKEKMKTKNKVITLVEIAVVLCSVFLVAIPAIAAEQNTQKERVSAMAASKDDFVLSVYGNANEDDTIDMRDLTYVKLIFFGERPETELADAKYDGEINPLDFVQIKLIIVGKEKELTLVDSADRIVTVKKPVERTVLASGSSAYFAEAIQIFGAENKIVGVSDFIEMCDIYYPKLSKLPSVGGYPADYEAILSLNPDLVTVPYHVAEKAEKLLSGITVVALNFWNADVYTEELMKLGYIFGEEEAAKHYIDDFHDKYIGLIKEQTEKLSEEGKPKVYLENGYGDYKTYAAKSGAQQFIDITGGKNIFVDIPKGSVDVDPEAVVERNPDIIIRYINHKDAGGRGYHSDDVSTLKAVWEDMMNRPELANVTAVKNKRVYIINSGLQYGAAYPIALTYWAKWFHPDLFEDLDPQAIHQEYMDAFFGIDFNVYEHGIFVYHPEQHPDGH
jgi:iron complex transport system substrate-binding protein